MWYCYLLVTACSFKYKFKYKYIYIKTIASLKVRSKCSVKKQPWINVNIRRYKRDYRKAERRWKKSGLHVDYTILRESLLHYNTLVKDARTLYFSGFISDDQHNPRILLKTFNQLVNPTPPSAPLDSDADCEMFLSYFTSKVESIKASIIPSATYSDAPATVKTSTVCHMYLFC